ncbi:MAG: IS3 family transposase [Verrucomicrobiota bacterium]
MITRLRDEGFGTEELCAAMGVSRSGYHAHQHKPESTRRQEDSVLRPIVAAAFAQSRETYGTPRLREAISSLTQAPVSRARIARLMNEPGIAPRQKRAFIPRTAISDPSATPAPNLLLNRPQPPASTKFGSPI